MHMGVATPMGGAATCSLGDRDRLPCLNHRIVIVLCQETFLYFGLSQPVTFMDHHGMELRDMDSPATNSLTPLTSSTAEQHLSTDCGHNTWKNIVSEPATQQATGLETTTAQSSA